MKTDTLWIVAFALGFIFSFAVANSTPGIGLFIGVNSLAAALWYFGKKNREAKELLPTKSSEILLTVLTAIYVVLTVPYLYRLDNWIIGVLVAYHFVFLVIGALYFALPGMFHIVDLLSIIISPIAFGLTWLVESVKSVFELFKENANMVKLLLKVVLYATVSLVVFILFAKLLSAADAEFKIRIDKILESLDLIVVMRRTILAVVMSFVSAGLLAIVGYGKVLPLFGLNVDRAKQLWDKAFKVVFSKRSDAILPIIITTPILFLFALYVWVQFSYLFGQDVTAILAKYSFADYARRGFVELLVVCALTYPLLSWSMNQSKSEWKLPRFITFVVNSSIVSLVVVMLYSLIMRMNLYMQTYGPSVLRFYVIVGSIFVGVALLTYEILSIVKAMKPGFAVFSARLFNDYVLAAMFSALGLLCVITIYPWNNVVANQIVSHYEKNGKLDVTQIMALPLESSVQVFRLGKTLEADGTREAGLLLQAHAVSIAEDYKTSRDDSIFSKVFGFNLSALSLLKEIPVASKVEYNKRFTTAMTEKIDFIQKGIADSLENNDFEKARSFFDPEMKSNDIAGFSDEITVTRSSTSPEQMTPNYVESMLSGGSTINAYQAFKIYRPAAHEVDTTLSSTIGFRNGKVVLLDNTLILAYLPDAVVTKEIANRSTTYGPTVGTYGYRTFCKTPNLDAIFSGESDCYGYSDYGASKPTVLPDSSSVMAGFLKSDFVTKAQ